MERTKYTPKRLLSLLLALIMLLGMFPTATLAAGTEDGIVLNSGEYKNSGLVFKFEPILPEGPYFQGDGSHFQIHYTISTATGEDYVEITELSDFARYDSYAGGLPIAGSQVPAKKASDSANSEITKEVTTADGSQTVRVYNPGVVIAEGDFSNYNYISADGDNLGKLVQYIYFAAFWYGTDRNTQHYSTNTGESGGSNSIERCSVSARYLPLGYTVAYSNGGYSGVSGIPEGTFRTTGSSSTNQTFKISDVEPTLAGCTFKGWRSNEWKKTDEDGHELTGDAALFQPGDTVEKVPSDTVLTAVWKENASEHKVEFYHNFPDGSGNSLFTTVHVADGEGAENPGAPYKHPEGYIFKDWCVKAEVGGKVTLTPYDFAAPVTEDIKLYADWTQVTEETTYTVTFDVGVANAGPVPGTQVITSGQPVPEPTVEPTRDGYTFAGWYLVQADGSLANEAYDFGTAVTKDITLRAKWTRNQVKITWPAGTSDGEFLTHTYHGGCQPFDDGRCGQHRDVPGSVV
ncbi:MAG: InlB B-repeat-containing protein [Oscillospiraceae bacterium]